MVTGYWLLVTGQLRQILVRQDPPFGWSSAQAAQARLILSARRRSYLFFSLHLFLFVNHDAATDDDMTCLPALLSFPLPPFD